LFAGVPDYTIDSTAADRIPLTLFNCFQEGWRGQLSKEATLFSLSSGGIEWQPANRIEA